MAAFGGPLGLSLVTKAECLGILPENAGKVDEEGPGNFTLTVVCSDPHAH